MKLYRYRPLSEILFKELLYSEVYLASPKELNDPLDLNGQLNFYSENEVEIKALVHFLFRHMLRQVIFNNTYDYVKDLHKFVTFECLGAYITKDFSNRKNTTVTKSDLLEIISMFCEEHFSIEKQLNKFDTEGLFINLNALFAQFLNNGSVACFSESYNNFLMWSHYASGHAGICLEFDVDSCPENIDTCFFPLISSEPYEGKYLEWTIDIKKVKYTNSLTNLRFYDYLLVFNNEYDIDLINLSKSYWHQYANRVETIFLEKLVPWVDEKEWRIVSVDFQETMPENRIYKYKSSVLTGVYFGVNTSEETQNRVRNAVENGGCSPAFYICNSDGTREVSIEKT